MNIVLKLEKKQNVKNNTNNTTLSEQLNNYHIVGTVTQLPHCRNS